MKTLVLSLLIKDDSLYSQIVEMLAKQLKENGINVLQQTGPGSTILNGIQVTDEEEEQEEKEEEQGEEPEEVAVEPKQEEPEEVEMPAASEAEPEEMTVAAEDEEVKNEEIVEEEQSFWVKSFWLGDCDVKVKSGVTESILYVDEITVDAPYALFKFKDTSYRYPICENTAEGASIALDFYSANDLFREVKCLLKKKEDQDFDLTLSSKS